MDSLTQSEVQTLALVCDTLLPVGNPMWRASIAPRASAILGQLSNPDDLRQLRQLLRWFEVPAANGILGRRWTRFSVLGRTDREAFLQALAHHRLSRVRKAFLVLKRLAVVLFLLTRLI